MPNTYLLNYYAIHAQFLLIKGFYILIREIYLEKLGDTLGVLHNHLQGVAYYGKRLQQN